jgi:23S rRNA pseudouridine2457 synthase
MATTTQQEQHHDNQGDEEESPSSPHHSSNTRTSSISMINKNNNNTPIKRKRRGGGCYHCGSLTHRGKACPEATCRHCGETGHDVGGCPQYQASQRASRTTTTTATPSLPNNQESSSTTIDNIIPNPNNAMHFKMYKPVKVLSQFVFPCKRQKGKGLLGDFYDFPPGTMAIGRLDADSEGLLLLTRDGKTSARYTSTKTKFSKEYHVEVDGTVTQAAIDTMCRGVEIKTLLSQGGKRQEAYTTLPCEARILVPGEEEECSLGIYQQEEESNNTHHRRRHRPTSWISITIREGKFRQVRKMTAVVGFPTLRLIRVRIGDVRLEGLAVGQVAEVESL